MSMFLFLADNSNDCQQVVSSHFWLTKCDQFDQVLVGKTFVKLGEIIYIVLGYRSSIRQITGCTLLIPSWEMTGFEYSNQFLHKTFVKYEHIMKDWTIPSKCVKDKTGRALQRQLASARGQTDNKHVLPSSSPVCISDSNKAHCRKLYCGSS